MSIDQLAFLGLLLAMPLPLWRLAASAPVRYRRRDQVALVAVLTGYSAAAVGLAIGWRELLPGATAAAATVVLALWWRARPGFGGRAGIPPGRLLVHPTGPIDEPDHLERLAKRYGPIFKIGATFPVPTLTPIVCVVGHDLGLELLRDHGSALEVYPPFPTSRLIPRGFLRNMTIEDHDRYAPVFRSAFSAVVDDGFERYVADAARRALAAMAADGATRPDRGISPAGHLRSFAFDVLGRWHFGVEAGTPEQARLAASYRAMDIPMFARWTTNRSRRRTWQSTVAELARDVDHPASDTADPPRSVLGDALATARHPDRQGGGGLDEATVIGNVLQMQESGTQDLSALLLWVVKHLGDHPVWVDRVRDEATATTAAAEATTPDRSMAEKVVRESLRLEQSEFLVRRTTADIRFRGFLLPKGWRIRICIREGHRDPAAFLDPSRFDPDRFGGALPPPSRYAPFGMDRHRCVAAQLVPLIGRIFVEELARGYRLAIVADGPREHGRFHWQPSPRLRVRLEPRT